MLKKISLLSLDYPKTVIALMLLITMGLAAQMVNIRIDTDPENMLEIDQPDRAYYDEVKKEFGINDLLVVGIVDKKSVFRPETLGAMSRIMEQVIRIKGVIIEDVISFTTTDNVSSKDGSLVIEPIMGAVPESPGKLEALKRSIYSNPLFVEKIISKDGNAAAIYIPIEEKKLSRTISEQIEAIAQKELKDGQKIYIAGLPVAEDVFGHEMFKQMAYTAPAAGMMIFLLLFLIFRKISLIFSPMIVAMCSIAWAMGSMIGMGHTVHIMSSMIPVFLMPIAVLDSVHILSEFYDRYPQCKDRKKTLQAVIEELFTPMLYTSITTAVGFGSLALTDIPPVAVFGKFIAGGVMAAWLLTITLVPAFIMVLREETIAKGLGRSKDRSSGNGGFLSVWGRFTFNNYKIFVAGGVALFALGLIGASRIVVNDNPVKWFKEGHKIRIADDVLNKNFGGTYMAYLTLLGKNAGDMKKPEVLQYIDQLQAYLEEEQLAGKTSSAADIIKRINYVLHDNDADFDKTPNSSEEIGQYYFLFLSSGDPDDLDNFVDYDYQNANIWVQMKSGDNKDMEKIIDAVKQYTSEHPPPDGVMLKWSGLTYINKVWQDMMVVGMLKAVLGGFLAVFILMVVLFRSVRLGFIAMMPLTFAITLTYGLVGFFGKNYDMPIAVCSTLTLGLSIDFAIHFIHRFRKKFEELEDMEQTNNYIFREPARAIVRNAVVISIGFLPMAFSTLSPYITVGLFFASLMTVTATTTLLLLPALLKLGGSAMFKEVNP
ncbi:Putative transporter [hydrothermal vent metagenome]|uniref:Transporter n=1 Tax=hydrothermal vent metagenome TaxID=652676 RepID=A0A3B1CP33_9ZZZZ